MSQLPKVSGFKKNLHYASCFGASIVIIGALFKIQHWPGSDIAIIAGLGTEAVLFILFGLDVPHEEFDWTIPYPELLASGNTHDDPHHVPELPVTEQLDNMLTDAHIDSALIERLGTGLKSLSDSTKNLNDIGNAAVVTNKYIDKMELATNNVSTLSDSFEQASSSLTNIAKSANNSSKISEHVENMSVSLNTLNTSYELQLQSIQQQVDITKQFTTGMQQLTTNISASIEDTAKYREEMAALSSNLTALNNIYGNMLGAMNFKK